jgi:hypothetical protein
MRFILTLACVIFLISHSFSQETTDDEYKYLLKNARAMFVENPFQNKHYALGATSRYPRDSGGREIIYMQVLRKKDGSHAGIIAAVNQGDDNQPLYLAIPLPNSNGSVDLETTVKYTIERATDDLALKTWLYSSLLQYLQEHLNAGTTGHGWSRESLQFIAAEAMFYRRRIYVQPVKDSVFEQVFVTAEQEALFPGGATAWREFLQRNVDSNKPIEDGCRGGMYQVTVEFIIDTIGATHNVHITNVPKTCPSCGLEGVRVIRNSGLWIPAMQNGRKVVFLAKQQFTWNVIEKSEFEKDGGPKKPIKYPDVPASWLFPAGVHKF